MVLGERIREARLREGFSQEEVAHDAGLNTSNYGKIERGLGNPRFETLVRIAGTLGVDPAVLVKDIGPALLPDIGQKPSVEERIEAKRRKRSR